MRFHQKSGARRSCSNLVAFLLPSDISSGQTLPLLGTFLRRGHEPSSQVPPRATQ
jgi:hypothetical protein